MKKLLFLFAAAIVSLTSCSSDDDNDNNGNGNKLTKSIVTSPQPSGDISKINYTYNGTKIATSSTSNTNKAVYTYSSDVLSKIEFKENDITKSYIDYTFEKGDLKSTTEYNVEVGKAAEKSTSTEYTYDETAKTQTAVTTTYPNGVPNVSKTTIVNFYDAEHLIKSIKTTVVDNKNNTVVTETYKYDTNKNPMVNVTGYPTNIVKGSNNVTTIDTTTVDTTNGNSGTPTTTQATYSYEYDSAGFPTIANYVNAGKLNSSAEYNYNN